MKIRGKALWANVHEPNRTFDPTWQIDLVIDESQVAGAEKAGLKVIPSEDGLKIKFRRRETRRDGQPNKAPVVVNADLQPFNELIGNGSEVIVQFNVYEWSNKFGKGTGADLQGVQVIEHVPYVGGDGSEFEPLDSEFEKEDEAPAKPAKAKAAKAAPPAGDDFDDDLPDLL